MAGHSKWANIRFRKSGQDAKRGKLFTKYIREITVAARQDGADPTVNPRLRAALDKALAANMTRDTLDRAIKRGAGGQEGGDLEEVRYEGYGPGGVAIMVECMTNNRNRTVSEVRHAFVKQGGHLGTDGSVSYLFKKQGHIIFPPGANEEKILEVALEKGAQDIQTDQEGTVVVLTSCESFSAVKQAIEQANLKPDCAEITLLPSMYVSITDKENAVKLNKLIDMLEELGDVQSVYSNGDIADEFLSELIV